CEVAIFEHQKTFESRFEQFQADDSRAIPRNLAKRHRQQRLLPEALRLWRRRLHPRLYRRSREGESVAERLQTGSCLSVLTELTKVNLQLAGNKNGVQSPVHPEISNC